jgi:apolipoprotein N-acyltransferase
VRSPRRALADGWLAGAVFFTLLLRWLDYTFQVYSAIPWPLTWLPIIGLAGYLGLYVGGVTAATSWLARRLGPGWALAAVPFLWVAAEWVRGHLLSGFPWGLLGYSQYRQLALIQVGEWTGVYGVSFLVALVNAALTAWLALGWRRSLPALLGAGALVLLTAGVGWQRAKIEEDPALLVAIVQPSIEQATKWNPDVQAQTLAVYRALTLQTAGSAPTVVVWPETAIPAILRRDPAMLEQLRRLSGEIGTPLVIGTVDDRREAGGNRYFNSAVLLSKEGIQASYDKIHLVPFGEYIPLRWLIGFVQQWAEFISDFSVGTRETVFPLGGASFGVVICYEGIFPELFRGFVARGARWMVNMTNDAWFGRTSGPWQHLAMLPFRAVEHRVSIARAANTGVSAFVEPNGRIRAVLPLFERGVLTARVPLRRSATFYTRVGDLFAYLCLGLTGLIGLRALRVRALGS